MNFSENEVHSLILRSENEHFARRCRHYKSKDSKAEWLSSRISWLEMRYRDRKTHKNGFPESLPTLQRTLKQFTSEEDKELYRLVSDMRIAEFTFLLKKFQHVRSWKISDVLYEALAQHYGLTTTWG